MSCEQLFFDQLRQRGLRLTPQREMVLSILHEMEGMVTAEEVLEKVRRISSAVDISTIYRTLDLLQEFDLVAIVDMGDGQRRFELLGIHGPHLHLVCHKCGRVIGIEIDHIRSFANYLWEAHNFEMDVNHLSIPGLCRDCAVASKGKRTE